MSSHRGPCSMDVSLLDVAKKQLKPAYKTANSFVVPAGIAILVNLVSEIKELVQQPPQVSNTSAEVVKQLAAVTDELQRVTKALQEATAALNASAEARSRPPAKTSKSS